ncbi:MAG: guanylate kinase [bacterium]
MLDDRKIFIISAPSATGKDAVATELLKTDLPLERMLTATSRPRRSTDRENDYHFLTEAEFRRLIDSGGMIEWVEFNQHLYGTRWQDLRAIVEAGKSPIMDIDVRGARSFKQKFPTQAVTIFLVPDSLDVLRRRLEERGTAKADIVDRLNTAQGELKLKDSFDYQVVNRDGYLDNAVRQVAEIIRGELAK